VGSVTRGDRAAAHGALIAAALIGALPALSGCGRQAAPVAFHAEGYPTKLSEWNVVLARKDRLVLNDGVVPYYLNTPLFTDYAHKLRTVWMPKGAAATYSAMDTFEFPVGTVISKTFYYPRVAGTSGASAVRRTDDQSKDFAGEGLDLGAVRLIETRLLVRRESGWVAMPYVWNPEQTDAELARAGDAIPMELVGDDSGRHAFTYVVPNANQCAGCHAPDNTTRKLQPIGPKARHLNREYPYASGTVNQIAHLQRIGYLGDVPPAAEWPRNADWRDQHAPLTDRARAYLDINCGHCHNARGPADTSGLWLDAETNDPMRLGLCKPPVAAGQGTGDFSFDVVPGQPERSILVYRMQSTDPGAMMPELGRGTAHAAGVELVSQWIREWPGQCDLQSR
jgi:uncharacterized repeat protein (TIGR03806 family)